MEAASMTETSRLNHSHVTEGILLSCLCEYRKLKNIWRQMQLSFILG